MNGHELEELRDRLQDVNVEVFQTLRSQQEEIAELKLERHPFGVVCVDRSHETLIIEQRERIAELERQLKVKRTRGMDIVMALQMARRDIVNLAREVQNEHERGQRGLDAIKRIDAALAEWVLP